MRRKKITRKIAFLAAAAVAVTGFPQQSMTVQAETEMTDEEFEELIGTYSINDEIPGYQEYVERYETNYPEKEYRINATEFVRYEEDGCMVEPEIYKNYENVPGGGDSLLTTEESLVEYDVTIEESGFYDISLVYYPIEGKNTEIQRAFFIDGELPYGELALSCVGNQCDK